MAFTVSWDTVPGTDLDPDSPITTELMTSLYENGVYLKEWIGDQSAAVDQHAHAGLAVDGTKVIDATNLSGQLEPRPECFGMVYYEPLGTAGEKALDVMDATPLFGFMCGPGSAGDWYCWANGMAANNSRNITTGNLAASTAIYNGRFLGLTAERSNGLYGDRLNHLMMVSPNDRGGTPHGFVSVVRYQGTGASNPVAHGLGSAPEFVFVTKETGASNVRAWAKGMSVGQGPGGTTHAQSITAVSATTVTMGTDAEVNTSGQWYTMLCVRTGNAGAEEFGILEWAGDGSSPRNVDGLGFAPDLVIAFEKAGNVNWIGRTRYFTDDNSQNLNDGTYRAEGIYQLRPDGIRVSTQLNTLTENYIAACFKGVQRWG